MGGVLGEFIVINEGGAGVGDVYAFGVRNDFLTDVSDVVGNWTSKIVSKEAWDEDTGATDAGSVFAGLDDDIYDVPTGLDDTDFDTFFAFPGEEGDMPSFAIIALYYLIAPPPITPGAPPAGGFFFESFFPLSPSTAFHTGSGMFETGPTVPPGVIPIPATLPLLLTGLAGLGLIGWRRRKAA